MIFLLQSDVFVQQGGSKSPAKKKADGRLVYFKKMFEGESL